MWRKLPIITKRFVSSNKPRYSRLDNFLNFHYMMCVPTAGVGFCYGVNEFWKENQELNLIKYTLGASAYGIFGAMFGAVFWAFTPIILPVAGASYIKKRLSK